MGHQVAEGEVAHGVARLPGRAADVRREHHIVERGQRPFESREELSPLARAGEVAAFGLRMNAGWPFDSFRSATGFDLREQWSTDMRKLADDGLALIEPDRFRLNSRGLRFADSAAMEFLRS